MERIVYRKTLDVHKNGVQFMLQGFETADKMSRRIELSLMASGDAIDFPLEQITAVMYVTTPNAAEPSLHTCVIKDNTIIYDVLPITEEGITVMQVKLIGKNFLNGTNSVLSTPKFAVEVTKSDTDDESATQTSTFNALENALDRAREVYDKRFLRIELDTDCMFRAIYADGTVYESDVLKELFLKGDALLSQSYAKGGTGVRLGEDTDNSMYYSNVSRSASEDAKMVKEESAEILTEVQKHGVYTAFYIDFEKGTVEYISPSYKFVVDTETGELKPIGEAYKYEDTINHYVNEWFEIYGKEIPKKNDIGCEYRIIDGETEWYNPPMMEGVEYRTTERYNGKPVYVKRKKINIFGLVNEYNEPYTSETLPPGKSYIISGVYSPIDVVSFEGVYKVKISNYKTTTYKINDSKLLVTTSSTQFEMTNNSDKEVEEIEITVKFTKK